MRSKSFGERIADVLIEEGLLLPNQLEEAVAIQKSEGGRLLKILTDKEFVTEQDMAFSMGRCLNTPPVNLSRIRVPEDIMALVPRDMATANKLVPIARVNGKLFVLLSDGESWSGEVARSIERASREQARADGGKITRRDRIDHERNVLVCSRNVALNDDVALSSTTAALQSAHRKRRLFNAGHSRYGPKHSVVELVKIRGASEPLIEPDG